MSALYEELIHSHLDAAYNLARWLLRDPHDAEDAVQEACLRAFGAIASFRGENGRSWFLTIVRNVCYSQMRKNRRQPLATEFNEEIHGTGGEAAEAKAVAWRDLNSEFLRQGLERLPEAFRELIVLHELEGLSYREIATVTEVPIGTVMSRLSRARRKLEIEVLALAGKEPAS